MTQHDPQPSASVAVVGAGVSGLAMAWQLERAGIAADVIDAAPLLGGRSSPAVLGERTITLGGKNIGTRYGRFRAFVADHGDHAFEYFGPSTSREHDGKLRRIDAARRGRTALTMLRSATPRDLLHVRGWVRGIKQHPDNRFLRSPMWAQIAERSDDRPLAAHLSARFCEAIVRTVTVRMNGAEPDEVNLGTFGTNLGMLDTYEQLRDGLAPVLDAFARRHAVMLDTRVTGLLVGDGRVTGLELERGGRRHTAAYDAVVLAMPAPHAAGVVRAAAPALADRLAQVRYFPAAAVVVEYDRDIFPADMRAVAFGPAHPLSNAGAYGAADLRTLRYTFSGRAARDLLAERGGDPEYLAQLAEATLAPHFPVEARWRTAVAARHWDEALCAFVPRHGSFLDEVDRQAAAIGGLHLTGDYFRGASIEACFRAAEDRVAAVREGLAARVAGATAVA